MEPRGSDRLQERFTISEDQLKKLATIANGDRARIVDWWIRGQPGIDRMSATLQVKRADIGRIVEELIAEGPRAHLELFPIGIPFPEEFQINIKAGVR
jgi:hypothetical protein